METLHATVKRPLTLFSVTAWQQGYGVYLEEVFSWNYPVYFHFDKAKVNFYHKRKDFDYFKKVIAPKLILDTLLFEHCNATFLRNVEELKNISITEATLPRVWQLAGHSMMLYIFIVSDAFVHAVPLAWESRAASERILYEVDEAVEQLFKKKLTLFGYSSQFAKVLTEGDFMAIESRTLNTRELALRLKGYIVEDDILLVNEAFDEFCKRNSFLLEEDEAVPTDEFKGSVAFKGKAQGRVVLVITNEDAAKVQTGDIIVSIMTNATHLPAMKRAAAVVTDEGGITCHASITARELEKPCVVGTKYATRVLKEGDLVEVDADNGIVRKI